MYRRLRSSVAGELQPRWQTSFIYPCRSRINWRCRSMKQQMTTRLWNNDAVGRKSMKNCLYTRHITRCHQKEWQLAVTYWRSSKITTQGRKVQKQQCILQLKAALNTCKLNQVRSTRKCLASRKNNLGAKEMHALFNSDCFSVFVSPENWANMTSGVCKFVCVCVCLKWLFIKETKMFNTPIRVESEKIKK